MLRSLGSSTAGPITRSWSPGAARCPGRLGDEVVWSWTEAKKASLFTATSRELGWADALPWRAWGEDDFWPRRVVCWLVGLGCRKRFFQSVSATGSLYDLLCNLQICPRSDSMSTAFFRFSFIMTFPWYTLLHNALGREWATPSSLSREATGAGEREARRGT